MDNKNKKIVPKILSGFMELLPEDQIIFNRWLDIIKKNFELFGFAPLDTVIIEKSELLSAKTGKETEKQIYRFSRGGDDLTLRYDLTVPLARYVAQCLNDLNFPFRRYQIGKVFRGERPQKGRFREFYQCDIDVVGDGELSLLNDAEIPAVICAIFRELNLGDFVIKINNRKILNGLFKFLGAAGDSTEILRVIDKLPKIGEQKAAKELTLLGVKKNIVGKIMDFIRIKGSNEKILSELKSSSVLNDLFAEGVRELEQTLEYAKCFGVPEKTIRLDLAIARGLDYYTGAVYETFLSDYPEIGSVCSGGRYDNLAEFYAGKKLPGVGVSIGLTRLFDQLKGTRTLQNKRASLSKVLVIPLVDDLTVPLEVASKLRGAGIPTEVFFADAKAGKKFNYANKLGIPFAAVIGEEEIRKNTIALKNMDSGEQKQVSVEEAIKIIG